jgi:hypothetical protein
VTDEIGANHARISQMTEFVIPEGKDFSNYRIVTRIFDPKGELVAEQDLAGSEFDKAFNQDFLIRDPQLWTVETPNLYTSESSIYEGETLKDEYKTYYSGETGRVGHEMILDLTRFKHDYNIDCGDIAHRLMDYGYHAPTLSFPVHETLMVEPTESESKAEMDRFIESLIQIKRECEAAAASGNADNVVVNAPHTALELAGEWSHPYSRQEAAFPLAWVAAGKFFPYVTKIDNGYGDRNLVCRCMDWQ